MGFFSKWLTSMNAESLELVTRPSPPEDTAPEEDPDLIAFHRGMAAAQAEPVGSPDEPLTAATLSVTMSWMHTAYEAGELGAIWQCRLSHGYGAGRIGESPADWYWFNAYPALAALKMGKRDHPFVATCSGLADQACDRDDQRQREAQAAIEWHFFDN